MMQVEASFPFHLRVSKVRRRQAGKAYLNPSLAIA